MRESASSAEIGSQPGNSGFPLDAAANLGVVHGAVKKLWVPVEEADVCLTMEVCCSATDAFWALDDKSKPAAGCMAEAGASTLGRLGSGEEGWATAIPDAISQTSHLTKTLIGAGAPNL